MKAEDYKRGDAVIVRGIIVSGPDDCDDYCFTIPSNRTWLLFIKKDEVMSKCNEPIEETLQKGKEFRFQASVHSGPDKDNEYSVLYDGGTRSCIVGQLDIVPAMSEPGKEPEFATGNAKTKTDRLIEIIKSQEKMFREIQEAARYALASPHHVQQTINTVMFRLQVLMSELEKIEQE